MVLRVVGPIGQGGGWEPGGCAGSEAEGWCVRAGLGEGGGQPAGQEQRLKQAKSQTNSRNLPSPPHPGCRSSALTWLHPRHKPKKHNQALLQELHALPMGAAIAQAQQRPGPRARPAQSLLLPGDANEQPVPTVRAMAAEPGLSSAVSQQYQTAWQVSAPGLLLCRRLGIPVLLTWACCKARAGQWPWRRRGQQAAHGRHFRSPSVGCCPAVIDINKNLVV